MIDPDEQNIPRSRNFTIWAHVYIDSAMEEYTAEQTSPNYLPSRYLFTVRLHLPCQNNQPAFGGMKVSRYGKESGRDVAVISGLVDMYHEGGRDIDMNWTSP